MKKSRIFMVAGTLLLAVTAIFATKANKKFAGFTTAKFGSGYHLHAIGGYDTILTTQGTNQLNARIYTNSNFAGAAGAMFTKAASSPKEAFYF